MIRLSQRRCRKNSIAGVTLIELMVTVAILSIGVLAAVGSFRFITMSIQNSKTRTLSNNLAQEQIEKLKNLSYYMLLVTTSTFSDTRFSPPLNYDTGNYPAALVTEAGIRFLRGTRIDFAYQNGNVISTAAWTSNDTGLKLITTYIIWQDGNELHHQQMQNLMANPAANPLNAAFSGTVRDTLNNPIAGALVEVVDNSNWFGFTNSAGQYQFSVSQGSYTIQCSSRGYFSDTTNGYQSIVSQENKVVDFYLGRMSSGAVAGYVYMQDHLVISQVVATTGTATDVEYVELYNPTTYSIFIGDNSNFDNPSVVPIVWDDNNNPAPRRLIYISSSVPSNAYYLISNTHNGFNNCSPFTVSGITRTPDACWRFVNMPTHALTQADAGGFSIGTSASVNSGWTGFNTSNWPAARIDSVAWSRSASGKSSPASAREGTGYASFGGLQPNEQLIRMSAPGSWSASVGRAYDANNNSTEWFVFPAISFPPYNSSIIYAPHTGTPATGAMVMLNDPLSNTAICNDTMLSSVYRVCSFSSPNVATGTWTATISSGSYYLETTGVTMPAGGVTVNIPNASTVPSWPGTNIYNSRLNTTTSYALISGVVTNASNVPLANILVGSGGRTTLTSSTGRYFLGVSSGDVALTANYNTANKAYTTQTSNLTGLVDGSLTDVSAGVGSTWFTLSLGGILAGYFQTGSATPLPSRVAVALSGGNQVGQGISESDGRFYIANLTTGTYVIQPSLDPAEAASPTSRTVTLSSTGTATTVSTFTITNGMAEITGQVLAASAPITTGVLVVATPATLTGGATSPPPPIDGGSAVLCNPCYYGASSDSTGLYSLTVRSSTTSYKVYGWYTTFVGQTPTVSRKGPYTVAVSTAGQILSQNMSW